jgi:hypothetical protein
MPTTPTLLTAGQFLTKWLPLFADNEFQNIRESTFRDLLSDLTTSFAGWRELTSNRVRGAVYRVPFLNSLGLIPADYLLVGMLALAVNGTDDATAAIGGVADPVTFQLLRDSSGAVDALPDDNPATVVRVKARWVRISGTQQQINDSFPAFVAEDHTYAVGDPFRYTFPSGETRLFAVKVSPASFENPLPTGTSEDPWYIPFAPSPANEHRQNTDNGTSQASFVIRLASQLEATGLQRTVLVFEGLKSGPKAAISFKARNADNTQTPVIEQCLSYTGTDSDVWTALGSGGGQGGAPDWAPGKQTKGQLSVDTANGKVYRAKQDMLNSTTQPSLNATYYALVSATAFSDLSGTLPAASIVEDATHRFATDTEKTSWNNKLSVANNLSDLGSTAVARQNLGIRLISAGGGIQFDDSVAGQRTVSALLAGYALPGGRTPVAATDTPAQGIAKLEAGLNTLQAPVDAVAQVGTTVDFSKLNQYRTSTAATVWDTFTNATTAIPVYVFMLAGSVTDTFFIGGQALAAYSGNATFAATINGVAWTVSMIGSYQPGVDAIVTMRAFTIGSTKRLSIQFDQV